MGNLATNRNTLAMFNTIISVPKIDDDVILKAKEIFKECKRKGIILDSEFEDIKWKLTDEYSKIGMVFTIPDLSYQMYYHELWNLSIAEFIDYMKAFALLNIGKLVLSTIRTFIYDIHRLLKCDPTELTIKENGIFLNNPSLLLDFISMLPEPAEAEKLEKLTNIIEWTVEQKYLACNLSHQRKLANFNSYFLFNDILNDYWNKPLPNEDRLFYYPIYLWWNITAIIPLRPREFILTPRKCLRKDDNGNYYLTLRRNNLKGSNKAVKYNLDQDYYLVEYQIPKKLAHDILKYIELTKEYESTELDTLFITDLHYRKWDQKKHKNSRFFTYININTVLRYFFNEVVEDKYGVQVVYDKKDLTYDDRTLLYFHLGDTRHIALINIIAEGGTPVLTMMLAGHDNIEMSSHYFSNITELIECKTYRQYKRELKGDVQYSLSLNKTQFPINVHDFIPIENKGQCYSSNFINGDFKDCMKVSGPNGEIGYCPDCPYYRKTNEMDYLKSDNIYRRKISEAGKHLKEIINKVRVFDDNQEDIIAAMMKLKNTGFEYELYLKEKYQKEN